MNREPIALFCRTGIALGACALLVAQPMFAAGWETLAPLPEAVQEVAVAALDGQLVVVGGFDADQVIVDTVSLYDPVTDSWAAAPSLPSVIHHATASAVGGKLYVIGGWADFFATPLDSVYEFDPLQSSWTLRSPMPTARASAASAVFDGKIYVAGGWPVTRARDFAAYDPVTDQWQVLPDLPTGRNHLGVGAAGGRIFAIGGRVSIFAGVGNLATVEAYDPQSQLWSAAAPLPRARGGLAVASFGRFVFAIGGEGNAESPDGVFEDVDVYDASADAWTSLDPMPTPRHGSAAAVVAGRVHVPGGGVAEGFGATDVHEALDVHGALGFSVPATSAVSRILLAVTLLVVGTLRLRTRCL